MVKYQFESLNENTSEFYTKGESDVSAVLFSLYTESNDAYITEFIYRVKDSEWDVDCDFSFDVEQRLGVTDIITNKFIVSGRGRGTHIFRILEDISDYSYIRNFKYQPHHGGLKHVSKFEDETIK